MGGGGLNDWNDDAEEFWNNWHPLLASNLATKAAQYSVIIRACL